MRLTLCDFKSFCFYVQGDKAERSDGEISDCEEGEILDDSPVSFGVFSFSVSLHNPRLGLEL